jgi:hypothetical protein
MNVEIRTAMTEPASPQVLLVVELSTRPGAQQEMREALDRLIDATRHEDRRRGGAL